MIIRHGWEMKIEQLKQNKTKNNTFFTLWMWSILLCPEENICTDEVFCSADAFNFLLFASAENDSCCRFTKCHPRQEDELQQLKNQHFLGGHLSDFVLGSYRKTAASSQESSLCCHFLILFPNPNPVLSRGGPSRPQGNATAGMTPGFGFPFRSPGSHSQLGELGQDQSKAWAQASGFKGACAMQLSGTLSPQQNIFWISGTYKFTF